MSENSLFDKTSVDNILLEVKGVSLYANQGGCKKKLLEDLNFQIKKGAFTALMGRSGIGKSLTIKAILGFLDEPWWRLEGDIIFYDDFRELAILKNGVYDKEAVEQLRGKKITAVFQGPDSHLHPSLGIGWQVGETIDPARPWKNRREAAKRMEDVSLTARELRSYPHQLSQGQRQRVAVAMALTRPTLIIADEITTALDEKVTKEIILLLKNLRREKKIDSMLFITHDLDVIERLFEEDDNVMVMDKEESGPARINRHAKFHGVKVRPKGKGHPLLSHRKLTRYKKETKHKKYTAERKVILRVNRLKQDYYKGVLFPKRKTVLADLDIKVREGEFFGIAGKSGCGKTTLTKAIVRLLKYTRGNIFFMSRRYGWRDLVKLQPDGSRPDSAAMREIRKELQVIFQDSASIFNPKMTIGELLSETLKNAGVESPVERKERMKSVLLRFSVCRNDKEAEEILGRYPGELSGGERQRLAIIRVFLLEPRLIIADEPFTEQDIITKEDIVLMMEKMRRDNGTAFIIISHEMDLISNICDTIAVIDQGKVAETLYP